MFFLLLITDKTPEPAHKTKGYTLFLKPMTASTVNKATTKPDTGHIHQLFELVSPDDSSGADVIA